MSKPKAPKPPDPYQTANADFAYNNFNQRTPYGNVDITAPIFDQNNHVVQPGTVTMQPTPELQRQLQLQNQLTEGALGLALNRQNALYGGPQGGQGAAMGGGPMGSGSGSIKPGNQIQPSPPQVGGQGDQSMQNGRLPDLPTSIDFSRVRGIDTNFDAARQRVEQANFARARSMLDPVFAEQERGLRTSLADQGIPMGSEARNTELGNFFNSRNQAYGQAALDSVLSGGQEQSRMYGMTSDARRQDITDQLQNFNLIGQNRATLFNELQALLGQQQVAQPTLQNFYAPTGSNFLGAQQLTSNMQSQNYATGAQMFGDMMGAASSLAGGAMMSDVRTKTDIKKVGKTDDGHNVYTYRYKGSPLMQLGVMAQEVEKKNPGAVVEVDGIKFVDYSKVH